MKKIFLVIFCTIAASFLFPQSASAIYVERECQNGPSISNSGGCGTSCMTLCTDTTFVPETDRSKCESAARDTESWERNNVRRSFHSYEDPFLGGYMFFTFIRIGNICSTADKYNTSNPSTLRAGQCSCDVGGVYKACCLKSDIDSDRSVVRLDPKGACINCTTTDNIPPNEGDCFGGSAYTTQLVDGNSYHPACPQNTLTFTANNSANGITVKSGENVTLRWNAAISDGYKCTIDSDVGSAITGASFPNGSLTVRPTQKTKYTVACDAYYRVQDSGSHWRNTDSLHKEHSITVDITPVERLTITPSVAPSSSTPPNSCITPNDPAKYPSATNPSNLSAVISWSSTSATSCRVTPSFQGNASGAPVATSSTGVSVSPPSTTTYVFTCENAALNPGSVSSSTTVNVRNCARAKTGDPTTYVEWSDPDGNCNSNYDDCRLESPVSSAPQKYNYCRTSVNPWACVQTSGDYATQAACETSLAANLPGQTTGVCYATQAGCAAVCPPVSASVSLTANPGTISSGCTTLTSSGSGVHGCSIDHGIPAINSNGNDSKSACPGSTTTYTLTCRKDSDNSIVTAQATVMVNPINCYVGPRAVSAGISATRECLPAQPGNIRDTQLNWSGNASNQCGSIIGGGSPSSYSLSCANSSSNWNGSGSGSSSISGSYSLSNVSSTQSYSVQCTRDSYNCSSSQTFGVQDGQNHQRCIDSCASLRSTYPAITSCSCSQSSCVEEWPHVNPTTHCEPGGRYCGTTHEVCDTCCFTGWVVDPITMVRSCPGGSRDCNCRDVCNYDGDCMDWECLHYGESQSVSSQAVCSSSDSDSQQVRFMNQPVVNDLRATKPQILLNQTFEIIWSASVIPSGVGTILRCTPSMLSGGDGKKWTDPNLSTVLTGVIGILDVSGMISELQPQRTTTYQLQCRNNDQAICSGNLSNCSCYNESSVRPFEMKVFEPYLQEKSPSFINVFSRALGSVFTAIGGM